MTGTQVLSNVNGLYAALQTQPLGALATVPGQNGGSVSTGNNPSLASISGPGQLLSNLQQLQAQDPAKFQQVVSTIASQLQTAAQQQGNTPTGQVLSNLANQFQNVAQTGNLSQLQPHHHGHHHGHHGYNRVGQSTGTTDTTSQASRTDLRQLFSSLNTQVSQALAT